MWCCATSVCPMEVVTRWPRKPTQKVISKQLLSPASAPRTISGDPKKPDSIFIWSNPLTFRNCKPCSTRSRRSLRSTDLANDAPRFVVITQHFQRGVTQEPVARRLSKTDLRHALQDRNSL